MPLLQVRESSLGCFPKPAVWNAFGVHDTSISAATSLNLRQRDRWKLVFSWRDAPRQLRQKLLASLLNVLNDNNEFPSWSCLAMDDLAAGRVYAMPAERYYPRCARFRTLILLFHMLPKSASLQTPRSPHSGLMTHFLRLNPPHHDLKKIP